MKTKHLFIALFFTFSLIELFAQGPFTGKPQYQIQTKRNGVFLGNVVVELFPSIAPLHVRNFDSLVNKQFFDSTAFHRVIPGFMIQGGDPNSKHGPKNTWGIGDTSQPTVNAEFSAARHLRSILSAARDNDTNSANSQFFICVAAASWLDGQYSVYGKVVAGMDIVDTIVKEPRDSKDNPFKKIEMFITYIGSNDTIPNAPLLLVPVNAATGIQATQQLSWAPEKDGIIYLVETATDSSFTTNLKIKKVGINNYTISNLLPNTKYYWRVKTNNGGHISTYSQVFSFTTATGSANLVAPHDTATKVVINPVFKWDTVPGATSYRLQIAKSFTFSQSGMVFNQAGINGTTLQVSGLTPNLQHFWRIRSANGSTEGFYSKTFSFTTGNNTGIFENEFEQQPLFLKSCFPNPANNFTSITILIPEKMDACIKLYDVSFKEVKTVLCEKLNIGEQPIAIELANLKSGTYFITFQSGVILETRKLIIEK